MLLNKDKVKGRYALASAYEDRPGSGYEPSTT